MPSYRLLDHTADLGFTCDGKTREELFATAAVALCDIIARVEKLSTSDTREVSTRGADDAARLRAFLDEVLFAFETKGFLAKEATVAIDGDSVRGVLRGQKVDVRTHEIERVVKAVTYHGLEVRKKKKGGWTAKVILDL